MLENVLVIGSDANWLPTAETMQGTGGLCSSGDTLGNQGGVAYRYLPFAKNGINCVSQQGVDVISYNFTGCLMGVFKHNDGVVKVCHVSTGHGQDCKDEWQNVKAVSSNVFEFRPSDFIEANGQAFDGCYGLITNDLRTYSITVARAKNGARTIASVTMARLLR